MKKFSEMEVTIKLTMEDAFKLAAVMDIKLEHVNDHLSSYKNRTELAPDYLIEDKEKSERIYKAITDAINVASVNY